MTNEIIFNKLHSGLQADLLTNESYVQDNATREPGKAIIKEIIRASIKQIM